MAAKKMFSGVNKNMGVKVPSHASLIFQQVMGPREANWDTKYWVFITALSQFSSVAQSCPTLQPHESQHARPPRPWPTPRVHSDWRPSGLMDVKSDPVLTSEFRNLSIFWLTVYNSLRVNCINSPLPIYLLWPWPFCCYLIRSCLYLEAELILLFKCAENTSFQVLAYLFI